MGIEIGQRFGRWTVVSEAMPGRRSSYVCRCDCGTERSVMRQNLLHPTKPSRSCGCGRERQLAVATTHGMTNSPEFSVWRSMKTRCYNPNHHKYPLYGGRGIIVCDEWLNDFAAFYAYVGPRPSMKHTLDRIDGDRNYEPGNVRWATPLEQRHNRRSTLRASVPSQRAS